MTENSKANRYKRSFGYWLKTYRMEMSWTQQYLARKSGISLSYYGKIEAGYRVPSHDFLQRLAQDLGFLEDLDTFVHFGRGRLRLVSDDYKPTRGKLPPLEPAPSLSTAVEMHFDFPESVKVPCEQYLLYFVEFLRDVGIDATAELWEDAGKVMFAVTPKDKDEALDNIREALDIYLRLPMDRNPISVISPETSIEVQRLSANIHHLQGELFLARAALQQNELVIHQQQTLIQQQALTTQVLVQSLQREADRDVDTEALGTDIIKVKPWSMDAVPFEVDLPELLRRLKEKFGRKQLP